MSKTKAEMRVEIAKDVLGALKAKRFLAGHDGYLATRDQKAQKAAAALEEAWENKDLKALLKLAAQEYVAPKQCTVCAIGAVFVATVDRHDSLKLTDVYTDEMGSDGEVGPDAMMDYLKQWFTVRQLRLIEVAYEGNLQSYGDGISDAQVEKAKDFHRKNGPLVDSEWLGLTPCTSEESAEGRMTAIMKNVIDNHGSFRP